MTSLVRKSATIYDIAEATGLSKTTVANAINGRGRMSDETRESIRRTAAQLGYVTNGMAQGLRHGRNDRLIGFVAHDLSVGVGTEKVRQIQRRLLDRGYDLTLHTLCGFASPEAVLDEAAFLRTLNRMKPQALVCATGSFKRDVLLAELRRYQDEGGVLVCYDYEIGLDCDTVLFDREDNTYQATRHLLELGHRKIAFWWEGMNEWLGMSATPQGRVAGFRRALAEWGVAIRPEWIGCSGTHEIEASGARLARRYLDLMPSNRPTGVCMLNDLAASTFIATLARAGVKVPEDVSVVGHDNAPISEHSYVPITTVSHPAGEISQAAVDFLDSRLSGTYSGPARRQEFRGELVIRQSAMAFVDKG